jgi:hypothetical protein
MSFNLTLPNELKKEGWKVKIRDKERAEPPHVSIIKGLKTWRWGLRDQQFLDRNPHHREISEELLKYITANQRTLTTEWDKMYPHNPVDMEQES